MIALQDFINLLKPHFMFEDGEVFNENTKFKSLKSWDSLTSLLVITTLFEEFGFICSADHLKGCDTIADLYKLINHQ